jgi:Ca-activated chloride channel family protein
VRTAAVELLRLTLTAALAGVVAAPAAQIFRSGIDLVHFTVTAVDRKGAIVTTLTRDDFEIREDGRVQRIEYFARGDQVEEAPELHLGLLFDTSGSMEEDVKLSRTAAIRFLNALPDATDMTLVDFDTEVRVTRYGQADFARMVERIRKRQPDGWTAFYDAIGVYLDGANGQSGRKVLVLYTDGGDTRSSLNFPEVMDLVRASDVLMYAIGFLEHQSSSGRFGQRSRLQQITEATGGRAFFPIRAEELDEMYQKIVDELHGQYSLGYSSTNLKADGTWREVEVRLTRPDLKDLKLRTRKGYFAPYREDAAQR